MNNADVEKKKLTWDVP